MASFFVQLSLGPEPKKDGVTACTRKEELFSYLVLYLLTYDFFGRFWTPAQRTLAVDREALDPLTIAKAIRLAGDEFVRKLELDPDATPAFVARIFFDQCAEDAAAELDQPTALNRQELADRMAARFPNRYTIGALSVAPSRIAPRLEAFFYPFPPADPKWVLRFRGPTKSSRKGGRAWSKQLFLTCQTKSVTPEEARELIAGQSLATSPFHESSTAIDDSCGTAAISNATLGSDEASSLHSSRQIENPDFGTYLKHLVKEFTELPRLPDRDRTRNLLLHDIMTVTVAFPTAQSASDSTAETQPRILNLSQAVAEERAWILIGDAGEGKSTALYYLVHHFAQDHAANTPDATAADAVVPALIPVYIPLRTDGTSLPEQIWTALQWPDFHCTRELLDTWIAEKPFLFLIDRLEDTNSRVVIENLRDLMRRAPNARLVIASRPQVSLAACEWPQARIQPPTDGMIDAFLSRLLGPKRGADLFDMLAQNSLLDPFRRPLFTRLLTLTSPELIDQKRFTPAEMFRDVLEGRFLTEWEHSFASELEQVFVRDLLAYLAHEMIRADTRSVDRPTALRLVMSLAAKRGVAADVLAAEAWLDRNIRCGLMSDSHTGLQFWHSSFRDFFAAVWLEQKRYAAAATIYRRTWQPRWSECLLFYYGLLRGALLDKRLTQLLIGLPFIIRVLSVTPAPAAFTTRLILILRCLVQASSFREGRQRFVRLLPRDAEVLFLGSISVPRVYSHLSRKDDEDEIRYFFDLIGQLSIPEAFEYLRTVKCSLNWIAAGIMRSPDDRDLEYLGASIATDSPHSLITHRFLTSSDPRCLELLQRLIRDPQSRAKALNAVRSAIAMYSERDGNDFESRLQSEWTPLLTDLALHDDDEQVRTAAVRFLQYFGRYSTLTVPPAAHDAFIQALDDPTPGMRRRALDGLNCPALRRRLDILWRLLDDESFSIVSTALFNFRMCADPKRFAHAVLKVLRRYASKGSDLRNAHDAIISAFRDNYDRPVHVPLRSVALLTSALFAAPYKGLQTNAMYALDVIVDTAQGAPFFIELLPNDLIWDEARCVAFWAVVKRLHAEARPVVLRALQDESPRIRASAASACRSEDFGEDFPPLAGPILFRLLSDDDIEVRRNASYALHKYHYLDEHWHPEIQGNPAMFPKIHSDPVYLGPTSTSTPDQLTNLGKPVNSHYLQQSRQKEALPHIEPPSACS